MIYRVSESQIDPIITEALDRFHFAAQSEFNNRVAMKSDMEFYVSDQWDSSIKNSRIADARPCLTINRLPQFTRQITNGLRQNMPSIHAIPVGDDDLDIAKILDGMMRHIQDSSQAGVAYATANQAQVIAGLGFFRVVTEYVNEESFDQEIRIKRIKNPLSVYVDPASIEPDYSDAMYFFITQDLTHDEFERKYPDKQIVNNSDMTGKGDAVREWLTDKKSTMRIAEYWSVEEKESGKLYQLDDGKIVKKVKKGQTVLKERSVKERTIKWRMISAVETLEERDWAGKYIPIIPVLGEDIDVDGTRIIKGMVRDSQDPQRMYNYWASAQTEMIALAPKAPFIADYRQIAGFEAVWKEANIKSHAVLPYNATAVGGSLLPPPQRSTAEPPVQAMVQAMAQASEDLKATTGIYDAGLGARSNEVSGKAIDARKSQGDLSNYHYSDNFSYGILYLGKILVDLIPKTYDAKRVVRILGEDGTATYKTINGPSGEKDENGIEKIYDLSAVQFDVVVDVGPSYKTKRQQDSQNMTQLLSGNPDLWKVIGDLAVKAMDWPDAQMISERLKKALPPQLQDEPDGKQPVPPQLKQHIDQLSQQNQAMIQEIHKLMDEKQAKTLELESKERIAYAQIESDLTIKAMGMDGQANHMLLEAELASVGKKEAVVHEAALNEHSAQLQMMASPPQQTNQLDQSENPQQLDNQNNSMLP